MENKKREEFKRQLFYTLPSGSGINGKWKLRKQKTRLYAIIFGIV